MWVTGYSKIAQVWQIVRRWSYIIKMKQKNYQGIYPSPSLLARILSEVAFSRRAFSAVLGFWYGERYLMSEWRAGEFLLSWSLTAATPSGSRGGGCMAVKPFPSAFSLVGTAFSTYKRGQTADLAVVKMPNSLPNGAWCRGLLVGLTKGPSLLSWDDESAQVVRSNAFFLKGGGSCWYSHQQCVYCSGLAPDPIGGM